MNDWEVEVIELTARLWAEDARARLFRRILFGEFVLAEEDVDIAVRVQKTSQ